MVRNRWVVVLTFFVLLAGCHSAGGDPKDTEQKDVADFVDADEEDAKIIQEDVEEAGDAALESLEIIEGDVVLAYPRQEMQLHVRAINEQGLDVLYPVIQWESSRASVLKVVDGNLIPVSIGNAMVTARWGVLSASIQVRVKSISKLIIEPGGTEMLAGVDRALKVRYFAEDDTELFPPHAAVQWTASPPDVGTITNRGVLSAVAGGTLKVQARSESKFAEEIFKIDARYDDISCYYNHCCMVSTQQHLYCWGRRLLTEDTPLGVPYVVHYPQRIDTPGLFKKVYVTLYGACALDVDDRPWCWGTESYGRFGTGQTGVITHPRKVHTFTKFSDMVLLDAGTYLLDKEGKLYALGLWPPGAHYGGQGVESDVFLEPTLVDPGPWTGMASVQNAALCLYKGDEVYCRGDGRYRAIGDGEEPLNYYDDWVRWGGDAGISQVAGASPWAVCGLDPQGHVWCAGLQNRHGILGHEVENVNGWDRPSHLIPTRTSWDDRFEKLHFGQSFACGEKEGALKCWGASAYCQLGLEPQDPSITNNDYRFTPVSRPLPAFSKVSLGLSFGCMLSPTGELSCWGLTTDPLSYALYEGGIYSAGSCDLRLLAVKAYERPGVEAED